jgi:hypothetical protein
LDGIVDDTPGAFEVYDAGRTLEVIALGTVEEAILNIYLDTLKDTFQFKAELKTTVGGDLGKVLGLAQSIDKLSSAITDLQTLDFTNDPVGSYKKVKAVGDAVKSFGSDYKKTFDL